MSLFHKRLLILFSVALNVGVAIMAIVMIIHHSKSSEDHSWHELAAIVERLNLPEAKERGVLADIKRFGNTVDKFDEDLKKARDDILRFLAKKGPLDRNKLHRLIGRVEFLERQKGMAFESHVVDLRRQLGDEKGPLFFSRLLAHLQTKNQNSHR